MKKIILKHLIIITILLVSGSKTSSLLAQSNWLPQSSDNNISIEALRPSFKGDNNFSFASSVVFLCARFALRKNVFIIGELPFAHSNPEEIKIVDPATGQTIFQIDPDAETMVGNPYVGFEFHKSDSRVFTEIGVQIPIATENKPSAAFLGLSSDFDRFEAFAPHLLKISGKLNYYNKNTSNVIVRLRLGPTAWIPTEEGDTELLADYSAQFGYEGQRITLMAGITGRMIVTESNLDFGERTFHHLGASAFLNSGALRPGIHVKFPLDETLDNINYVLGVTLGIQLK